MEPSYDFADKGWYKPDGQTQTVRMRRTSLSSATLSSSSQPNSRAGTVDSDHSAERENRDPNIAQAPRIPLKVTNASKPKPNPKPAHHPSEYIAVVETMPTSPPSSYSSKEGMEKALLKRPSPKSPAKAKLSRRSGGAAAAAGGAGGRVAGGRAGGQAAIYVNELGPGGSWYIPRGTTPRKLKKAKDQAAVQPGLVKTWYCAFKKKLAKD